MRPTGEPRPNPLSPAAPGSEAASSSSSSSAATTQGLYDSPDWESHLPQGWLRGHEGAGQNGQPLMQADGNLNPAATVGMSGELFHAATFQFQHMHDRNEALADMRASAQALEQAQQAAAKAQDQVAVALEAAERLGTVDTRRLEGLQQNLAKALEASDGAQKVHDRNAGYAVLRQQRVQQGLAALLELRQKSGDRQMDALAGALKALKAHPQPVLADVLRDAVERGLPEPNAKDFIGPNQADVERDDPVAFAPGEVPDDVAQLWAGHNDGDMRFYRALAISMIAVAGVAIYGLYAVNTARNDTIDAMTGLRQQYHGTVQSHIQAGLLVPGEKKGVFHYPQGADAQGTPAQRSLFQRATQAAAQVSEMGLQGQAMEDFIGQVNTVNAASGVILVLLEAVTAVLAYLCCGPRR